MRILNKTTTLACTALFSLVSSTSLFSNTSFTDTHFDNPEKKIVTELGPSPYAPGHKSQLFCNVYPTFAVIELDEGEMGRKLSVHFRSKKDDLAYLCKQNFNGKKISLDSGVSLVGVKSAYIFASKGDIFGDIGELNIYDALSEKKIFTTHYNNNKPFEIIHARNTLSIIYYRPLKLSCVPDAKNSKCWETILKQNHITKGVKISAPDCNEAIKHAPDSYKDPDRSLQITSKVRVDLLAKPSIRYLDSDSSCVLTP